MNGFGLVFHHLGLAVREPTKAVRFLRGLGYEVGEPVRDPLQNVILAMADHPSMPRVEIVAPTETDGPLGSVLRANAELVYHLCYETEDAEATVRGLRAGVGAVRRVSEPKPAVLFGGRDVSFYVVAGIGLVELLEPARNAP